MPNLFIFKIALRYVFFSRGERFISITGLISLIAIALGVATLLIVMSVMNGFRLELESNINNIASNISILTGKKYIEHPEKIIEEIKNDKSLATNIKKIDKNLIFQTFIKFHNNASFALLKSVNESDIVELQSKYKILYKKNNDIKLNANEIIIGSILANEIGAHIGSRITILSNNKASSITGSIPRIKKFYVKAIINTNIYEYDQSLILINENDLRKFIRLKEDQVNMIDIVIDDIDFIGQMMSKILKITSSIESGIYIHNGLADNVNLLNALNIEKVTMFIILMFIIIIASFNMLSSLFMLVKDKDIEIASLQIIGANKLYIMFIFIIAGLILTVTGIIIGIIFGMVFLRYINDIKNFLENIFDITILDPSIYFLDKLPTSANLSDVIMIISASFILCMIATIYPAYKASIISPVDLIKNS